MITFLVVPMFLVFLGYLFSAVGGLGDPVAALMVRLIIAVAFADIVWSTRKK